jgi:beta-mannanase
MFVFAQPASIIHHGVFPGGPNGISEDATPEHLDAYEKAVGCKAEWVMISNEWGINRAFPRKTVNWIIKRGSTPYIRMMIRTTDDTTYIEKEFTVQNIIAGKFDADLQLWGKAAKKVKKKLIVEYGVECNNTCFPWSGINNGGSKTDGFGDKKLPDGPEYFVAAYRHIVNQIRLSGAKNITWVFHIDAYDDPEEDWNRMENYYPGDDWVDWIGLSVYGAQSPDYTGAEKFTTIMDRVYLRLTKLTNKPVIISEFGTVKNNKEIKQDEWADDALKNILNHRWPRITGFSWWSSKWQNDDNPAHDSDMIIAGNTRLINIFNKYLMK